MGTPSLKDNPTLRRIRDHLRVTKVVCTRSVKGRDGDHFVGFSAAWDSIQDDAGGGVDLLPTMSENEVQIVTTQTGLTLKEAKVASLVLAMQADLVAHDQAWAGTSISAEQRDAAKRAIESNYTRLIAEMLNGNGNGNGSSNGVTNG
jgi:hypothetical protein